MDSFSDNIETIADVARLGVYLDLQTAFANTEYSIELSGIGLRIYKGAGIIGRMWLYSNHMHAEFYIRGVMLPHKLMFDDPKFFSKCVKLVKDALAVV